MASSERSERARGKESKEFISHRAHRVHRVIKKQLSAEIREDIILPTLSAPDGANK